MIGWFRKFWLRHNPSLSMVVLYNTDGSTRSFRTKTMDKKSERKFAKHLFKSYDVKFVEIDGKPYFARGPHVESL